MVLLAIAVAAGASLFWMFRTEDHLSPRERIVLKYRWGKPRHLASDRNLDGVMDYRSVLQDSGSLAVLPKEFWEDSDYDGSFETHVVPGDHNDSLADLFELDRDGDGKYETVFTGAEADRLYKDLLEGRRQSHVDAHASGEPLISAD